MNINASELMPDPGKLRALQQVTTPDGFFVTCALDHGDDYRELIDPDISKVSHAQTVASKLELVSAISPHVSSFLLDPEYAAAHAILTRTLPRDVGLMVCIEEEGGYAGTGPKGETRFRNNWTSAKIARMGANVCKLLWFFRPESPVQDTQRQIVRDLAKECTSLSMPLMVEPIWIPLEGEDTSTSEWKQRRAEGIVESAIIADELGADVLKLEYPGSVDNEDEQKASAARCERITASVQAPWVILSAGVAYDAFRTQVRIACEAGASGFVAGRSIWRDAVPKGDTSPDQSGVERATSRLAELADITTKYGTPHAPALSNGNVAQACSKYWYRTWQ